MMVTSQLVLALAVALVLTTSEQCAVGQVSPSATPQPSPQVQTSESPPAPVLSKSPQATNPDGPLSLPAPQESATQVSLPEFNVSNIKFSLQSLARTLRDSRHEGWVLAAYPDPKTSRPLIGAGFSLDVPEREHIQSDPLNPNLFLEPSSAQLWQAAGLDPGRLQKILDQFDRNLKAWKQKNYRKKIKAHKLPPQVTDEEATHLLRVSAAQAVHNARAYCRNFDQLTASQQMALSQLVYQMGVNLEKFIQFLSVLNDNTGLQVAALQEGTIASEREHWKAVQQTLIDSQWAKRYSSRAVTVIAMFDADYAEDPKAAERQVQAVLRPPVKHHRKKTRAASV